MTKILILGGIREAADLAAKLVAEGHDVTTSLAGRTKEPEPLEGKTRIGGFGGAEGLARYLLHENIELLIDCTHPFARQISANAKQAAETSGVELQVVSRPEWKRQPGDHWIEVSSLDEAREVLPENARVLLALGSQHIDRFQSREDVYFVIRMVDRPREKIALPHHRLITGKPSTNPEDEKRILEKHGITHIVCRNSGGAGAYAKIAAARQMNLPVVMIRRP